MTPFWVGVAVGLFACPLLIAGVLAFGVWIREGTCKPSKNNCGSASGI